MHYKKIIRYGAKCVTEDPDALFKTFYGFITIGNVVKKTRETKSFTEATMLARNLASKEKTMLLKNKILSDIRK